MSATRSPRVALSAGVSTVNHGQDVGLQVDEIRQAATQRGWLVAGETIDEGVSSAKASRPAMDRMMVDAQARKLDVVALWKLDRLARSVIHLLSTTAALREWGVGPVSLYPAHIDTTTPSGPFVLQILGTVAELERGLLQERVVDGVRRAQAARKHCGRPREEVDLRPAAALSKEGQGRKDVARSLKVPPATLRRRLVEAGQRPVERMAA
jgi:DNA invertase Pin-like site-specific DNA recombinase